LHGWRARNRCRDRRRFLDWRYGAIWQSGDRRNRYILDLFGGRACVTRPRGLARRRGRLRTLLSGRGLGRWRRRSGRLSRQFAGRHAGIFSHRRDRERRLLEPRDRHRRIFLDRLGRRHRLEVFEL
jgi:hypothetical protein